MKTKGYTLPEVMFALVGALAVLLLVLGLAAVWHFIGKCW